MKQAGRTLTRPPALNTTTTYEVMAMSAVHSISYDPIAGVCYRTLDFMGLPGYRVGDDGSVWAKKKSGTWERMKQQVRKKDGRAQVGFHSVAGYVMKHVHTIVLLAFFGPKPSGRECCHYDNDPLNNKLENLRWGTKKENDQDKARHGTLSKLTAEQVREIRAEHSLGAIGYKNLARQFKVGKATIAHIIKRETWAHLE